MTASAVMLAGVVAVQVVALVFARRLIRRQAAEIERLRADRDAHRQEADRQRAGVVLLRAIVTELRDRISGAIA